MEFSLFEFGKYEDQWWLSICWLHVGDAYVAALHVERDQGVWKIDFLGLMAAYFWWKYRDD